MEQQRALNALEPYIALCKTASAPRAAADLIARATSDPHTFVFAELLEQPQIQQLRGTEYAPHLSLLEIFAWGTWADYQQNETSLPALSEAQTTKLRLLSLLNLLTVAPSSTHDPLAYSTLQQSLSLSSTLPLERLIQSAIYASLITGHLDQQNSRVAVSSVAPLRDLAPNSLPRMTQTLAVWEARCDGVLGEIEAEIERVRRDAKENAEREGRKNRTFEDAVSKAEARQWTGTDAELDTDGRGKKRGFGAAGRKITGRG